MKLIIKGEFPGLNEYINHTRGSKYAGASMKARETDRVYWEAKGQHLPRIETVQKITCTWYCKNKRKDKDNVMFAKKFILDGLILAKVIPNDGWNDIHEFVDVFAIDAINPRVEVQLQ
jgi:hypothetical protein